jgi:hypothetical protein
MLRHVRKRKKKEEKRRKKLPMQWSSSLPVFDSSVFAFAFGLRHTVQAHQHYTNEPDAFIAEGTGLCQK